MNMLAPELSKIKESGASKEEQAKMTFELYKKHKTNPFSGCFLVLVQIPIIFALYYVFYKGITFESKFIYSFIHIPEHINMMFLGILDMGGKSLVLAILAGVSQPATPAVTKAGSFQESFGKSMNMQMKYVFPFIIAFIAYSISGAVALYWITSNMFTVAQQIYVNRTEKKILDKEVSVLISGK
jgi:YidC/Oxa1 family membrane protein insertase